MIRKAVKFSIVIAGACAINIGLLADAEAVSIYLGNGWSGPETSSSFSYSKDGIDVVATAFDEYGSNKASVFRGLLGLGVKRGYHDSAQIDGKGADETLRLTFARTIKLVSATFSAVGHNDDADITLDGSSIYNGDIPNNYWGFGTIAFSNTPLGTVADFSIIGKNDDYFLKYVDVESVPEPLTILGSGLALAAGAALERKRSKKAKLS